MRRLSALLLVGALVPPAAFGGCDHGRTASPRTEAHSAASPVPTGHCDRYASPRGSDRGAGSRRHPYRTVRRLVRSLRPGQTGCLLAGRYRHRGVVQVGAPGTMLRSARGARALIDGAIWVGPRARGARIVGLRLTSHDPTYVIPLKVQADRARIERNVITANGAICVLVGSDRRAHGVLIADNQISHCGRSGKYQHLIYLNHTDGAVVRDNVLVDNPGGWAIQLYSDADRTIIERNLIDGDYGGIVFAGNGVGATSDGNVVQMNVITFSRARGNVEGSWSGGRVGSANLVRDNCLYTTGPDRPGGIGAPSGFAASQNRVPTSSPYALRAGGRYRLARHGACAGLTPAATAAGTATR